MSIKRLFLVFFGNNWRVVLLSITVATVFWFFNALNKNYSTRLNYPLDFSFQRDSVVVVDRLPDRVLVDVSGGGWNLMRKTFLLSAGAVLIELDNPTEIKFLTRATLLPMITEQLSGLSLDFVVTDTVFINIEPKISKGLMVAVDSLTVPMDEDYRMISPIRIRPDSILVVGPKSMIDTLNPIYLVRFDESDISSDYNEEFDIEFSSNLVRPLPDEVNVRFDVAEFNRSQITVPIESTNFPDDYSISLKDTIVNIYFTVRNKDLNKVNADEFSVTADLTMINKSDSTIPPILIAFPSYVMEIQLEPDTLTVEYAR